MSADEDKYPSESGRRRFVKGVVGSAALGTVATGTAATVEVATSAAGAGGGITEYFAIENTDGPAPRGMPIIPVEIRNDNEIYGRWPEPETQTVQGKEVTVAEMDVGGTTYSTTWFQYCGVQTYEGIQPDADQDNAFRSAGGTYDWQADVDDGAVLTLDMFDDYEGWGNGIGQDGLGKPAVANWRSDGDVQTIPVQVMRSPEVSKMIAGEGKYASLSGEARSFLEAATENDVMAWLNKCTHFCCVPGFKAFGGSARFGGENSVYCQCHQSIYDPFSPVRRTFTALPRTE
ncbi:ubiquinol-cytochrome c reductase iron-sulfur subunit [Halapricum desulfuricans]|uniref:Rieske Fe-S protein n=1 Tax=Halapricum desulfuricans TaxID=2841257 RepID=A0A897NIF2_9EURY|nr:ubiquinol-cytochrome c reductase iron-sulfur subunit [Halapricum desulfuricans]QSG08489.1 Rieske Fe-S protein [Halapricum desulfuricans]QSG12388.1 Rieske Fe-S protein [Halapricum desulfuricans]